MPHVTSLSPYTRIWWWVGVVGVVDVGVVVVGVVDVGVAVVVGGLLFLWVVCCYCG